MNALPHWNFILKGLLLGFFSLGSTTSLHAQQVEPIVNSGEQRFSRVFVPADQPSEWPPLDGYAPPIKVDEFEALLRTANKDEFAPQVREATITQLTLRGKLIDAQLRGTAIATIEVVDDNRGPNQLNLDGLGLAIDSLQWENDEAINYGLNHEGHFVLDAIESEELSFNWTLDRSEESDDVFRFDFALPSAQTSQLVIELPSDRILLADRVAITDVVDHDGYKSWQVECGGVKRFALRVTAAQPLDEAKSPVYSHQSTQYSVDRQGISATSRVHFTSQRELPEVIWLVADNGFQPTSIKMGTNKLAWQAEQGEDGTTRIAVPMPTQAVQQRKAVLTLSGVTDLPIDEDFVLPAVVPEDTTWLYGVASLSTTEPWEVCWATCDGGVATNSLPVSDKRSTPYSFAMSSPSQRLTACIRLPDCQILPSTAYTWQPVAEGIQGRVIANVTCRSGATDQIRGALNSPWKLQRIEVARRVDGRWTAMEAEVRTDNAQRFDLRLGQHFNAGDDIRLTVTAELLDISPRDRLLLEDLVFLDFDNARPVHQLGQFIPASEGREFHLVGSAIRRYRPISELTEFQQQMFADVSSGFVFDCDLPLKNEEVQISTGASELHARSSIRYLIKRNRLVEEISVDVQPRGYPVDLLQFNLPDSDWGDWEISVSSKSADDLTATEIPLDKSKESSKVAPVWLVQLSKRMSVPFQLTAQRNRRFDSNEEWVVYPPTLINATQETGEVEVWRDRTKQVEIHQQGLIPVPLPANRLSKSRRDLLGAKYRYSSEHTSSIPKLTLRQTDVDSATAFATIMQWESTMTNSGETQHQVTWLVVNHAKASVLVTLPESAVFGEAWLNGEIISLSSAANGALKCALPDGERYVQLTLCYREDGSAMGWYGRINFQPPRIDLPVSHTRHVVSVPSPYRFVEESPRDRDFFTNNNFPYVSNNLRRFFPDLYKSSESPKPPSPWVQRLQTLFEQPDVTWRQLLLAYDAQSLAAEPNQRKRLLLDTHELAFIGITPDSRVAWVSTSTITDDQPSRGLAELAILETDDELILTSRLGALTRFKVQSVYEGPSQNHDIRPVQVSRDIVRLVKQSGHLLYPRDWVSSSDKVQPRWAMSPLVPTIIPNGKSWSIHAGAISAVPTSTFTYVSQASLRGISWICLVVAAICSIWLLSVSPSLLIFTAASLAVLSCLLPFPFSGLAGMSLIGLAISSICKLLFFRVGFSSNSIATASPYFSSVWRRFRPALTILLIVYLASSTPPAHGVEEPTQVHRVVIPVKEDMSPAGQVYLPAQFYRHLKIRQSDRAVFGRGWTLSHAEYLLDISSVGEPDQSLTPRLTLSLQVNVVDDVARIEVPLRRDDFQLAENWAILDGRPLDAIWSVGDRSLVLTDLARGVHEIVLNVRPMVTKEKQESIFQLHLPPLPDAKLTVTGASAEMNIFCRVQRGERLVEAVARSQQAEDEESEPRKSIEYALGPTPVLEVRLQNASAKPALIPAEQLVWLRLDQSEPRLHTKTTITPMATTLNSIELSTTDAMKLQLSKLTSAGLQDVSPTVAQATSSSSTETKVTFQWTEPTSDPISVEASFVLPTRPATGQFILPEVAIPGCEITRRWLAVTHFDTVQVELEEQTQPLAVEEFIQAWGAASTKIDSLADITASEGDVNVQLRPSEQWPVCSEETTYLIGPKSTQIRYSLSCDSALPIGFWELKCPPRVTVTSVAMRSDAESRSKVLWSQTSDGNIRVQISPRERASKILQVTARLEQQQWRAFKLPLITGDRPQVTSRKVLIYRRDDTRIEFGDDWADMTPNTTAAPRLLSEPFHHVRTFSFLGIEEDNSPVLSTKPNVPKVVGEQVITIDQTADQVFDVVDFHLELEAGIVDDLHFRVPKYWRETLKVEPEMTHDFSLLPDEDLLLLTVRPAKNLNESIRLTLSAAHEIAPGQPVTLANVELLNAPDVIRYVFLPRHFDETTAVWRSTNLTSELRPNVLFKSESRDGYYMQVNQSDFSVRLDTSVKTQVIPQVRLADIRCQWKEDNTCIGTIAFDLEPAGLDHVIIAMPEQYYPVHAQAGRWPKITRKIGPGRWQIDLGARQLPQRVSLTFAGPLPSTKSPNQVRLPIPVLEDIQVERTIWTIYAPPSVDDVAFAQGPTEVSASRLEIIRLRSLTNLMHLPHHLQVDSGEKTLADWFSNWKLRWLASRDRLTRLRTEKTDDNRAEQNEINSLDRQVEAMTQRFAGSQGINPSDFNAIEPFELFVEGPITYGFSKGVSDVAVVQFNRHQSNQNVGNWLTAVGIALVCIAAFRYRHSFEFADAMSQWGKTACLVGSLVLIVSGWFAVVGWLILVVVLVPAHLRFVKRDNQAS